MGNDEGEEYRKVLVINTYPQAGVIPKATFEKKLLFLNPKVIRLRMSISRPGFNPI
jgi:hypothetical protein